MQRNFLKCDLAPRSEVMHFDLPREASHCRELHAPHIGRDHAAARLMVDLGSRGTIGSQ